MSIQVMSAVWELDLPREQKLVLMAFADHANDDGFTYPSLARVAWKCGYQQARSVAEIVTKLLETQVLVLIEKAHGRTPTLYQIRPHNAHPLPPFDPRSYKTDKGAENAPHEHGSAPKSLSDNGSAHSENAQGAENAPQIDSGAVTAPQQRRLGAENAPQRHSVGVRSDAVGVRSGARRGAVASAPEPLNRNNQDARARAGPGQSPARADASQPEPDLHELVKTAAVLGLPERAAGEREDRFRRRVGEAVHRVKQLNNDAALNGITTRMPDETLEQFERRFNDAYTHQLAARAAAYKQPPADPTH